MDEKVTEVDFWDCDSEATHLCHTSIGEAIGARVESLLDGLGPDDMPVLPLEIQVEGHARIRPSLEWFTREDGDIVERILERADDDYGAPDDATEATPEMLAAARTFLEAMHRGYIPWTCEVVKVETVDLSEWMKANVPDWEGRFV